MPESPASRRPSSPEVEDALRTLRMHVGAIRCDGAVPDPDFAVLLDAQDAASVAATEARLAGMGSAAAQCAALWCALEELSRWPDLPGVPYFVWEPTNGGEVKKRQIPADQVKGIMQAILQHAKALIPFGVEACEVKMRYDDLKQDFAAQSAALRASEEANLAMAARLPPKGSTYVLFADALLSEIDEKWSEPVQCRAEPMSGGQIRLVFRRLEGAR